MATKAVEGWTWFDTAKAFAVATKEYPPRRIATVSYSEPVDGKNEGYQQARSHARLMAAAPDLLALAERIADHFAGTDAPLGLDAEQLIRLVRA